MLPHPDFERQLEANRRAAAGAEFECTKGSSDVISPWGKVGSSRACLTNGVENGPWQAWENGTHVRGQYVHGKQEGKWQWFDSGALRRTLRYARGVEIYDSLADAASSVESSRPRANDAGAQQP